MLMADLQLETSIIISMRLHTQHSLPQVPHALCVTIFAVLCVIFAPSPGLYGS